MTPTEVLKMLKSKIDAAELNKCNYVLETSDIEAIKEALRIHNVVERSEQLKTFLEWQQKKYIKSYDTSIDEQIKDYEESL